MNEKTPAAVTSEYFEALGRGDVAAAMDLMSPNVTWHQPGANQFSGDHNGVESTGALLGAMMEVSEGSFQLAVTGPIMINGELAAVPVRFTGKRGDAELDMAGVDLMTIRDGKIVEVHLFSEDGPAEDSFWQ